jgi:hypothetical protein
MTNTAIEQSNIEMDRNGGMTTSSKGIVTLLPLFAVTAFGANTNAVTLNNFSDDSYDAAYVYSESQHLTKMEISEGIELSETNMELTEQSPQNVKQIPIEEFEVLEEFIGGILENSEQQPGELKSLMYDNIERLLI